VAVIGTAGAQWWVSDHQDGYSSGTTLSATTTLGAPANLELHCSLTRFQATNDGPPGAAIGVSDFTTLSGGFTAFGPDSNSWWPILYNPYPDTITAFTVSVEAVQADVVATWFALFWD
jgi:hypothetical protein